MNYNIDEKRRLLTLVGKFHQLLSIAWPKPGAPQMAGSSVFIKTNLFKALEDGLSQIKDALFSCNQTGLELNYFWNSFSNFFSKIKMQDRFEKSVRIDEALNLLYLASGVFYHRIKEMTSSSTELATDQSDVEELDKLLYMCKWTTDKATIKEIENDIAAEMNSLISKF